MTTISSDEFISRYEICDIAPINLSFPLIPVAGFVNALNDYLCDRFRGLVKINLNVESLNYIKICPEYTAIFIKKLLTSVYGRSTIFIDFESSNTALIFRIYFEPGFELEDESIRDVVKAIRNAGAEITYNQGAYEITIDYVNTKNYIVSAISTDGYAIILGALITMIHGYKPTRARRREG